MKKKYDELDARILACVAQGRSQFAEVVADCSAAAWLARSDRESWRTIDMRLQALRKAGKIKYFDGRWHIVEGEK